MAFLEVKDLRKSFGDLQVLKGISFSLEKGEVLAIIGQEKLDAELKRIFGEIDPFKKRYPYLKEWNYNKPYRERK